MDYLRRKLSNPSLGTTRTDKSRAKGSFAPSPAASRATAGDGVDHDSQRGSSHPQNPSAAPALGPLVARKKRETTSLLGERFGLDQIVQQREDFNVVRTLREESGIGELFEDVLQRAVTGRYDQQQPVVPIRQAIARAMAEVKAERAQRAEAERIAAQTSPAKSKTTEPDAGQSPWVDVDSDDEDIDILAHLEKAARALDVNQERASQRAEHPEDIADIRDVRGDAPSLALWQQASSQLLDTEAYRLSGYWDFCKDHAELVHVSLTGMVEEGASIQEALALPECQRLARVFGNEKRNLQDDIERVIDVASRFASAAHALHVHDWSEKDTASWSKIIAQICRDPTSECRDDIHESLRAAPARVREGIVRQAMVSQYAIATDAIADASAKMARVRQAIMTQLLQAPEGKLQPNDDPNRRHADSTHIAERISALLVGGLSHAVVDVRHPLHDGLALHVVAEEDLPVLSAYLLEQQTKVEDVLRKTLFPTMKMLDRILLQLRGKHQLKRNGRTTLTDLSARDEENLDKLHWNFAAMRTDDKPSSLTDQLGRLIDEKEMIELELNVLPRNGAELAEMRAQAQGLVRKYQRQLALYADDPEQWQIQSDIRVLLQKAEDGLASLPQSEAELLERRKLLPRAAGMIEQDISATQRKMTVKMPTEKQMRKELRLRQDALKALPKGTAEAIKNRVEGRVRHLETRILALYAPKK